MKGWLSLRVVVRLKKMFDVTTFINPELFPYLTRPEEPPQTIKVGDLWYNHVRVFEHDTGFLVRNVQEVSPTHVVEIVTDPDTDSVRLDENGEVVTRFRVGRFRVEWYD